MAEKDKLFSSKIKYSGVVNFGEFYKFCYEWLRDELGLNLVEEKYVEKLSGDSKNIDVDWNATREVTDYFKFEIKVSFRIIGLTNIEIAEGNKKIKTNKGTVEVSVKGTLIKDYKSKFEKTALQKFLRGIYEKTVIPSRVEDYDEFLSQAKAYLDLEGKR
jgi:NAD+--asparagine ADP-ribosyltransferase